MCENGSRIKRSITDAGNYPPDLVIDRSELLPRGFRELWDQLTGAERSRLATNELRDWAEFAANADNLSTYRLSQPFDVCAEPWRVTANDFSQGLLTPQRAIVESIVYAYWQAHCECKPPKGRCCTEYWLSADILVTRKNGGTPITSSFNNFEIVGPFEDIVVFKETSGSNPMWDVQLHRGPNRCGTPEVVPTFGGSYGQSTFNEPIVSNIQLVRVDGLPDECAPAEPGTPPPPSFTPGEIDLPIFIPIPGPKGDKGDPGPPGVCLCPELPTLPTLPSLPPLPPLPELPSGDGGIPPVPPVPPAPTPPDEDLEMDGTITIPRCDGGSTSYPYDTLDGFGSAMGYALAAIASDNCMLLDGEVVLPDCSEPDEEEVNIFLEIVVGIIAGQITDVIIAVLGRSGLQGIAAAILLQIIGEVLSSALADFFKEFLPQGSAEPENIQWQGRGIKGVSAQLNAVSRQVEKIGEILCQEDLPEKEDIGDDKPPAVVLLPGEPYDALKLDTQLVVRFGQNYPTTTGSAWHCHIPNPISGLSWCSHFESLSRTVVAANSQFRISARQYWEDSKVWSGGYFANKNEATAFLDWVVSVSQSTPGRRSINEVTKTGDDTLPLELAVRNVRAVRAVVGEVDSSSGKNEITNVLCYAPPRDGC